MKMFVLISHDMTEAQKIDAVKTFGVETFVTLPTEQWSLIPADVESVSSLLEPLRTEILSQAQKGDYLLVQGDFGATVSMVNFAYANGLIPVYATTQRKAKEKVEGDKVVTVRTFEHVRFRIYERGC